MNYLPLFSFIIANFQQAMLNSSVILHCWRKQELQIFAQRAAESCIYTQYVDLKRYQPNMDTKLRYEYFKMDRPVIGVFLDINCPNVQMVYDECSLNHLFNDRHHWLLYDERGELNQFRNKFEDTKVTVNSDVTYFIPDINFNEVKNSSTNKYFIQYDVYNNGPHIGGKLNTTKDRRIQCTSKNCQVESYLSDLYKRTKYGNRNSQNDINLRLSTVISYRPLSAPEEELIDFLLSENDPILDTIARFGFQQLIILKDMLKCNFHIKWRNQWSLNDTYGGMIGDLLNENVDLCSTPFTISLARRRSLIPLAESAIFNAICMFRTPLKTGLLNTGEVYLDPFDATVWIAFGITIIIGALQLWGVFAIERNRLQSDTPEEPSFLSSFLISFGTVCAQGSDRLPTTIGGRICYSVLILASFIMYNYYTSIIVSTLLGAQPKSDIKTLAQLADSSLEVGFEPIPFTLVYLNVSQVPAVRRLVERKVNSRKSSSTAFLTITEGVKRVRDMRGTFAYVFNAPSGYPIVEKFYEPDEICDLNEVSLRPEKTLMNLIHKNSSFVELFRLRFLRMLETGVNRRNLHYWMPDRLYCFPSTSVVTVALENTAALFFLLISAFIIAVSALFVEIYWHKLKTK